MLTCQRDQSMQVAQMSTPLISTWLYSVGWSREICLVLSITKVGNNC